MATLINRLIIVLLFCSPLSGFAATMSLEIINIKPAGTGSPAIPSTNRIFRAYPGIEYNIRAAVIGGDYPYAFSLSNAPTGMTINESTGEIVWSNPQSSSGTITLEVTDSSSTEVSTTLAISVSTSSFIFVNASYSGTETGSITQPYSTLANMLANETTTTDIVYFRAGTYAMVDHNSTADYTMNIDSNPRNWLGYPGEDVTLQGNGTGVNAYQITALLGPVYFDSLNIEDVVNYGLFLTNDDYHTVRRCNFDGGTTDTSINNNQGFIYMSHGDNDSSYFVIQDNEFTDFVGIQAVGSLYYSQKTLIENNYIHDGGAAGLNAFCTPIGVKTSNDYFTIRGNKIIMPSAASAFELYNEFLTTVHADFNYNYVRRLDGGTDEALYIFHMGTTVFSRNTIVGDFTYAHLDSENITLMDNIILGDVTSTYVTNTDTLSAAYESTAVIDSDGELKAAYNSYIGTTGWQFSDGSTPIGGASILQHYSRQ